jgi:hypothetical protein
MNKVLTRAAVATTLTAGVLAVMSTTATASASAGMICASATSKGSIPPGHPTTGDLCVPLLSFSTKHDEYEPFIGTDVDVLIAVDRPDVI